MKLDQHFTKPKEAGRLVRSLLHRLDPARARRYIEPACGEGAFVEALHHAGVAIVVYEWGKRDRNDIGIAIGVTLPTGGNSQTVSTHLQGPLHHQRIEITLG